ncbi:hypothetical protein V7056_20585 [Bacillus sp. JJ664]
MKEALIEIISGILAISILGVGTYVNIFYLTKERYDDEDHVFHTLGGLTHILPQPLGFWITKILWVSISIGTLSTVLYISFLKLINYF